MIQLQCHSATLKKENAHKHTVVSKYFVGLIIKYLKYRGTQDISLVSLERVLTSKVTFQKRRMSIKQGIHQDTLCQLTW